MELRTSQLSLPTDCIRVMTHPSDFRFNDPAHDPGMSRLRRSYVVRRPDHRAPIGYRLLLERIGRRRMRNSNTRSNR